MVKLTIGRDRGRAQVEALSANKRAVTGSTGWESRPGTQTRPLSPEIGTYQKEETFYEEMMKPAF
jgi:hypothetical protein